MKKRVWFIVLMVAIVILSFALGTFHEKQKIDRDNHLAWGDVLVDAKNTVTIFFTLYEQTGEYHDEYIIEVIKNIHLASNISRKLKVLSEYAEILDDLAGILTQSIVSNVHFEMVTYSELDRIIMQVYVKYESDPTMHADLNHFVQRLDKELKEILQ